MKIKKQINREIYQILEESGVPAEYWEKILTRLVNYTYKKVVDINTDYSILNHS